MLRQPTGCERALFDIVKEYENRFYYQQISKVVAGEDYRILVEKGRMEMVGKASVELSNGERKEYEIRYNRIVNLKDGYNLLVPRD